MSTVERAPIDWHFSLVVTLGTDEEIVQAILDVFPSDARPKIQPHVALSADPISILALSLWFADKLAGKAVDDLLSLATARLKEMYAALTKRGEKHLHLRLKIMQFNAEISIPQECLQTDELTNNFLAVFAEVRDLECFRNAGKVMMGWSPERECWLVTIWPNDVSRTRRYFLWNSRAGQIEEHKMR